MDDEDIMKGIKRPNEGPIDSPPPPDVNRMSRQTKISILMRAYRASTDRPAMNRASRLVLDGLTCDDEVEEEAEASLDDALAPAPIVAVPSIAPKAVCTLKHRCIDAILSSTSASQILSVPRARNLPLEVLLLLAERNTKLELVSALEGLHPQLKSLGRYMRMSCSRKAFVRYFLDQLILPCTGNFDLKPRCDMLVLSCNDESRSVVDPVSSAVPRHQYLFTDGLLPIGEPHFVSLGAGYIVVVTPNFNQNCHKISLYQFSSMSDEQLSTPRSHLISSCGNTAIPREFTLSEETGALYAISGLSDLSPSVFIWSLPAAEGGSIIPAEPVATWDYSPDAKALACSWCPCEDGGLIITQFASQGVQVYYLVFAQGQLERVKAVINTKLHAYLVRLEHDGSIKAVKTHLWSETRRWALQYGLRHKNSRAGLLCDLEVEDNWMDGPATEFLRRYHCSLDDMHDAWDIKRVEAEYSVAKGLGIKYGNPPDYKRIKVGQIMTDLPLDSIGKLRGAAMVNSLLFRGKKYDEDHRGSRILRLGADRVLFTRRLLVQGGGRMDVSTQIMAQNGAYVFNRAVDDHLTKLVPLIDNTFGSVIASFGSAQQDRKVVMLFRFDA